MSLGDFADDAGVAGDGVDRLDECVRMRGYELTLVVGATYKKEQDVGYLTQEMISSTSSKL